MKRSRGLWAGGAAAALLVAVPAGWYFGSPWWTLWRMREAARAGDVRTLARYVDMPAVAEDATAQLLDLRRMVTGVLDGRPDRRFLARLDRSLRRKEVMDFRPWLAGTSVPPGGCGDSGFCPRIEHQGLDGFRAVERRSRSGHGPALAFRRDGLGWKLVGVRWGQQ